MATMTDTPTPEYLTTEEAAALLRIPERTLLRLLKTGQIPAIYTTSRLGWRIRRADLLAHRSNAPQQPSTERPEGSAPDERE